MKRSWADIDEEYTKEEQKKIYVPPHKKESATLPNVKTVDEKAKFPHTPNCKKL